jgi:hypothetical protein
MAPRHQLILYHLLIDLHFVKTLCEVSLGAVGNGHDDVRFVWFVGFIPRRPFCQELLELRLQSLVPKGARR